MCLLLSVSVSAQTGAGYTLVWKLDSTLVGESSSENFLPANLKTVNVYAGNTRIIGDQKLYIPDGNGGYAYNLRGWGSKQNGNNYFELRFGVTMMQFDIESISFRARRGSAPSGTKFAVLSSKDNFQANIGDTLTISSLQTFEELTFPVNFENIDDSTFAFRIYAFGTSGVNGPTSLIAFDAVTISGSITDVPLPVELTFFKAEAYGKEVLLSWETTYERNSKEFVIERSNDLREYVEIGSVPAAGNTTGRTQYSFVDKTASPGANYYRLKIIDQDLTFETSNVKDVILRPDESAFLVAPNPLISNNLVRVRLYKIKPEDLVLINSIGQKLPFDIQPGQQDIVDLIPLSPLPTGIYILSYRKGNMTKSIKILVQ